MEASRTTRVVGWLRSASWSSFRLARYSWTIPMAELTTRMTPKTPSATEPVLSTRTNSTPRMALNRVKTLALTMVHTERELAWSVVLT